MKTRRNVLQNALYAIGGALVLFFWPIKTWPQEFSRTYRGVSVAFECWPDGCLASFPRPGSPPNLWCRGCLISAEPVPEYLNVEPGENPVDKLWRDAQRYIDETS